MEHADVISELVSSGCVRAAINITNHFSTSYANTGEISGPSVEITRAVGRILERPVEFIFYDSAAAALGGAGADKWDLAFIALDRSRSDRLHFTRPYLTLEATYLVRSDPAIVTPEDVDRPGMLIASTAGAAYDLRLRRVIAQAEIVTCSTPEAALALFSSGGADAVAGIRPTLADYRRQRPDLALVEGNFATLEQAVASRRERPAAAAFLDQLVAEYSRSAAQAQRE